MTTEVAIIEIPESKAIGVFTSTNGLQPYIDQVANQARSIVADVSTKKGRDQIASTAYKVRQSKSAMDKAGKALVDELKKQPKIVDAERKRMREAMDALASEIRAPLDEYEAKEAARVSCIKNKIEAIKSAKEPKFGADSLDLTQALEFVTAITIDESFEEFEAEAHREKAASIEEIKKLLDFALKQEAEQAELERLRIEAAEKEQKEREQRIALEAAEEAKRKAEQKALQEKQAAEAKAKAEREAVERKELELKLAAERAEREKAEAEEKAKQAAIDTERRLKAEAEAKAKAEKEEARRREADINNRTSVNRAALSELLNTGITVEQGKQIITLIAQGRIPNVSISY